MTTNASPGQCFTVSGKKITVYPAKCPHQPVIYLNASSDNGDDIYQALSASPYPACTLVVISNLCWAHDMSPWAISAITKDDTRCTGGADDYLRLLQDSIIPLAENALPRPITWRGLVGYSLAGLFAIYALYQTAIFSRVASISGSLWFPGFQEYIFAHEMQITPSHLYLSLGNREDRTQNPYLQPVRMRTEAIYAFYKKCGLNIHYELNVGNHFKNAVPRTVAGLTWLLSY